MCLYRAFLQIPISQQSHGGSEELSEHSPLENKTALTTEHHLAGVNSEGFIAPACLEQPDIVTVNEVECTYKDDVDVFAVGNVQHTQGNAGSNI